MKNNNDLLAICQVCIYTDDYCDYDKCNMTVYRHAGKNHKNNTFYNSCKYFECDWTNCIKLGVSGWEKRPDGYKG